MKLPDISEDVLDTPARLSPAVLQAAEMLGLYGAELARILHLNCKDIGHLAAAQRQLVMHSKAWHQACLFIRLYRALFRAFNGHGPSICHWLRAHNHALSGSPLLLIVDQDQLTTVLTHVQQLSATARLHGAQAPCSD